MSDFDLVVIGCLPSKALLISSGKYTEAIFDALLAAPCRQLTTAKNIEGAG